MKLNELKEMSGFKDAEQVNRFTVRSAIANMRFHANRILAAWKLYHEKDANTIEAQLIFDSIKGNLNDYVQAFTDIAVVLLEGSTPLDTLSSVIRAYSSTYDDLSRDAGKWLDFLHRRNSLVHEYYNYEFLSDELKTALTNYDTGILELVDSLELHVKEENKLQVEIKK